MEQTFLSFISIIAAAQGAFLGTVMFFHKIIEKLKRQYLAIFIITFSLWLAEFSAYWSNYLLLYPHLIFCTKTLPWLYGPLLFLFSREFVKEKKGFKSIHLLHFIPFIVRLLTYIPFYLNSGEKKTEIFTSLVYSPIPNYPTKFYIYELLNIIQLTIYIILTYKLLNKIKIKKRFVVKSVLLVVLLYFLKSFLQVVNSLLFDYHFLFQAGSIFLILSSVIIYALSYYLILKPAVILNRSKEKYARNKLSQEKIDVIKTKILDFIVVSENFLNPKLTLDNFSRNIDVSTNQISQVINSQFDCSFTDFVNKNRVEEVKKRLLQKKYNHYNIFAIAKDCGFSTKAAFYNAFKKHTGKTPTQFKKEQEG